MQPVDLHSIPRPDKIQVAGFTIRKSVTRTSDSHGGLVGSTVWFYGPIPFQTPLFLQATYNDFLLFSERGNWVF
jgi:hypothetical protein